MTQPDANGIQQYADDSLASETSKTASLISENAGIPQRALARIQPESHCEESASDESRSEKPRTEDSSHISAEQISATLMASVGSRHFQHWFAERSRFEISANSLIIFVPNPFFSNWIIKRFRSQITEAAITLLGPSAQFELLVDDSLQTAEEKKKRAQDSSAKTQQELAPVDANDHSAQRNIQHAAQKSGDYTSSGDAKPLAVKPTGRRRFRRFDSIVEGECNKLSLLASKQVADSPGELFNPLYVHGPTGCGKTHLLEAIYSQVRTNFPALNVMFISSEAFTNYFLQALESRTVASFRQKFRNVDILLIDNIEFLDNKKATQEEFLHTVVQLLENGGQLVVSGDRHPRLLTKHREEVTTRFQSGMVCRIESPDDATRKKVTKLLALPYQKCFTKEALNYVAMKCRKSIREIQGAINCLQGHFQLSGDKITLSRARELLGDLERECRRLVRLTDVEKIICNMFGVTVADLRSKSRRKAIATPRSLAMYIARKLTGSAYREIGGYFGGRDHSTVVAAERRVKKWIDDENVLTIPTVCKSQNVAEMIQELEERLMTVSA